MVNIKQVRLARKGNHHAFQDILDEEKVKLYKMAYMYAKNEEDALEIFQETIYKALVSIKDLKEDKYFSTWITRILIHTAFDFIKKRNRIVPMNREVIEDRLPHQYSDVEDRIDLLESLGELDEKYKTVLMLRFFKDYTVKEIASILDCPEGTVKTNIHRGIQLLRGKIKEDCVNE
ncbi:sigma-70 family RNA polymerase sigma factor [Bacillus sp. 31A1R]|uniref:Sigma-70 family RNA polymerase sigma factor n=1 Tax=Robertmurraya mangrovi TaxID=3098077 RepID=A0ABU5IWT2_9BACI|nr:sigma-70 family RNA polymerase sigma factor [Bacillus sp. 31A1R]MDZ5471591.1 sigma-70 family RNA polymerase sigma factor [Bacillus sp. 31A1R]